MIAFYVMNFKSPICKKSLLFLYIKMSKKGFLFEHFALLYKK